VELWVAIPEQRQQRRKQTSLNNGSEIGRGGAGDLSEDEKNIAEMLLRMN
jgi:hypothetical protein